MNCMGDSIDSERRAFKRGQSYWIVDFGFHFHQLTSSSWQNPYIEQKRSGSMIIIDSTGCKISCKYNQRSQLTRHRFHRLQPDVTKFAPHSHRHLTATLSKAHQNKQNNDTTRLHRPSVHVHSFHPHKQNHELFV